VSFIEATEFAACPAAPVVVAAALKPLVRRKAVAPQQRNVQ